MAGQVALVTGGNKGIGFEVCRQLGQRGYRVLLAGRDDGRVRASADKLKAEGLDVSPVVLDVTDAASIRAAAETVSRSPGRLDVLVNNAGIATEMATFLSADVANFRTTFETNVFGVVAVTQAFAGLVKASPAGRIVNVSSGLGSLVQNADPKWEFAGVKPAAYNASKAALNMLTILLAAELAGTPVKVNAADPGYTATDLNANSGPQTVQEGSEAIVRLATLGPDGPTGQYFDRHGPLPW